MAELTRVVLDSPVDPAFLPCLFHHLASAASTKTAIFAPFTGQDARGRMAQAITKILNTPGEASGVVWSYRAECVDRDERIVGAATMLGVLLGVGKTPIIQLVLDSLVADADSDFMARMISTGVLAAAEVKLPQDVCDRAWAAAPAIASDSHRLWARTDFAANAR